MEQLPPPTKQEVLLLSIKRSADKIELELGALRETMALYAKNVLDTKSQIVEEIASLRSDLAKSRDYRFDQEEQKINGQLEQVERAAQELRKQLEQVQNAKSSGATSERIQAIAERTFTKQVQETEQKEQTEIKTRWEKRKETAINAAIGFVAVIIVGALLVLVVPAVIEFLQTILARLH